MNKKFIFWIILLLGYAPIAKAHSIEVHFNFKPASAAHQDFRWATAAMIKSNYAHHAEAECIREGDSRVQSVKSGLFAPDPAGFYRVTAKCISSRIGQAKDACENRHDFVSGFAPDLWFEIPRSTSKVIVTIRCDNDETAANRLIPHVAVDFD